MLSKAGLAVSTSHPRAATCTARASCCSRRSGRRARRPWRRGGTARRTQGPRRSSALAGGGAKKGHRKFAACSYPVCEARTLSLMMPLHRYLPPAAHTLHAAAAATRLTGTCRPTRCCAPWRNASYRCAAARWPPLFSCGTATPRGRCAPLAEVLSQHKVAADDGGPPAAAAGLDDREALALVALRPPLGVERAQPPLPPLPHVVPRRSAATLTWASGWRLMRRAWQQCLHCRWGIHAAARHWGGGAHQVIKSPGAECGCEQPPPVPPAGLPCRRACCRSPPTSPASTGPQTG